MCRTLLSLSPRPIHLHWLLIKACISYKLLPLTYKFLHALAPPYLTDLFHHYTQRRRLRSSNSAKNYGTWLTSHDEVKVYRALVLLIMNHGYHKREKTSCYKDTDVMEESMSVQCMMNV
ncbi:unnamed protein product [Pleuronectes platessa]|uniref:Uncharacterized protein n=1 Tax=Pleuronectes platessa TaxID=8262 RepID=A0A9N7V740_PLEPL|nr:unnamed protein product [Pleuronectes platessa]